MTAKSVNIKDFRTEIPGELIDEYTWGFPPVVTLTSHGSKSVWVLKVKLFKNSDKIILPDVPQDAFVPILDKYFSGQLEPDMFGWHKPDVGINGNINKNVATIVSSGKNITKINATNPWTQALRDALGMYNKKLKKVTVPEEISEKSNVTNINNKINDNINDKMVNPCAKMYPPMLAQVFDKKKISDDTTVWVQIKYDGLRAVSTLCGTENIEKVFMYSRGLNVFEGLNNIKTEIATILADHPGVYIDGEIYKHGVPLQQISGDARRGDANTQYDYMVYDCFVPENIKLLHVDRMKLLDKIFAGRDCQHVIRVVTYEVKASQINTLFDKFIAEDFEGAMVRLNEPYKYSYNNYHCAQLLKIKKSFDAELEIVDWTVGKKGKAAGALMIVCKINDKIFPVTPALELPDRIAMAKKFAEIESNGKNHFVNQWLGKKIIIIYDDLSKDGVPQRARTKMEIRTWD